MRVKCIQRCSRAAADSFSLSAVVALPATGVVVTSTPLFGDAALAGAPVVGLLHELEIKEGLRPGDSGNRADPSVHQVEQMLVVLDDDLGEQIKRAGGHHDVVDLADRAEFVGDLL